jgi:Domain of unknown function (DUF4337)
MRKKNPALAPVSVIRAILAVLVAVGDVARACAHTEEVVLQAKASDQWAYYRAKIFGGMRMRSLLM